MEEETSISETWPFSLRRLGEIGARVIFEFDDGDEPCFAISGGRAWIFCRSTA